MQQIRANLQEFANKHKLIFEDRGEVGFGRSCVGFLHRAGGYVEYNPTRSKSWEYIWPSDPRLRAPKGTPDAYHKHDCMAVLVRGEDYDAALKQLSAWVEHLEAQGELEVVDYETGALGMQAILTGIISYAIRFKEAQDAG